MATANELFGMVGGGKIKIEISNEYPLRDAAARACRYRSTQDHRLDRARRMSTYAEIEC